MSRLHLRGKKKYSCRFLSLGTFNSNKFCCYELLTLITHINFSYHKMQFFLSIFFFIFIIISRNDIIYINNAIIIATHFKLQDKSDKSAFCCNGIGRGKIILYFIVLRFYFAMDN